MLGVSNWPSVHLDKLFEQTPRRTQEIQLRYTHRQTILYTRSQRMHSAPNSLPYTRIPTIQWPVLECTPVISIDNSIYETPIQIFLKVWLKQSVRDKLYLTVHKKSNRSICSLSVDIQLCWDQRLTTSRRLNEKWKGVKHTSLEPLSFVTLRKNFYSRK